jgi:hypothetical protein
MSTAAIRNVILRLREEYGDEILPGQAEALRLADEEVVNIERAAKVVATHGIHHVTLASFEEIKAAEDLMQSIAKEAP